MFLIKKDFSSIAELVFVLLVVSDILAIYAIFYFFYFFYFQSTLSREISSLQYYNIAWKTNTDQRTTTWIDKIIEI